MNDTIKTFVVRWDLYAYVLLVADEVKQFLFCPNSYSNISKTTGNEQIRERAHDFFGFAFRNQNCTNVEYLCWMQEFFSSCLDSVLESLLLVCMIHGVLQEPKCTEEAWLKEKLKLDTYASNRVSGYSNRILKVHENIFAPKQSFSDWTTAAHSSTGISI